MRSLRLVGPALAAAGVAILAYGLVRGEGSLSLVLIFPVITATGPWSAFGILLVIAGLFTTFLSWPFRIGELPSGIQTEPAPPASSPSAPPTPPTSGRRWGGIVFLGPFPIVFGSDSRITWAMLLVAFALFVALVALTLLTLLAMSG